MVEKLKIFLKNSIGYILATFFTLAYMALSILEIRETGKTIIEIIGSSFVYYVFQMILITLFRSQGLTNGKRNALYQTTLTLHGTKVESISQNMDLLPIWCEKKNKQNYKERRTIVLGRAALKYDDYFDENGDVKQLYCVNVDNMRRGWKNRFKRIEERKRIKAFNSAVKLKLSRLDATSITSADKSKEDKYALPESEKEFMGISTLKDIIIKIMPALLFGYYGAQQLENFSWAAFAWITFQALMGYVSAITQMLKAQNYIINDVRTGIVKKIGWIDEFSADISKNIENYKEVENNEHEQKE